MDKNTTVILIVAVVIIIAIVLMSNKSQPQQVVAPPVTQPEANFWSSIGAIGGILGALGVGSGSGSGSGGYDANYDDPNDFGDSDWWERTNNVTSSVGAGEAAQNSFNTLIAETQGMDGTQFN